MHKERTQRRMVVKGARQKRQACVEQADKSRKGPKRDLQEHLPQLFHHYCQEEEDEEEVKEKNVLNKTTLPTSLAPSRLEFPLNLCISHMQSLCAPQHLTSTTVFPVKP